MGIIYKITNKIDGKIYVGQTISSIKIRFRKHLYDFKKGVDYVLYRAMRKHGVENFYIEMIEECNVEFLDIREVFWIKELESINPDKGYNTLLGRIGTLRGKDHPCYGKKASPELRAKLSFSHTERYKNKAEIDRRKAEFQEQLLRPGMIRRFQKAQKRTRLVYTDIKSGISFCCESLEDLSKVLGHKSSGPVSNILNGRCKSLKHKIERIIS